MRLASLARKIKITPSKLTEFLSAQEIDLTQGSNTKLNDAQIAQVLLHFGKELPTEEAVEELIPDVIEELVQEPIVQIEETKEEPILAIVQAVKETITNSKEPNNISPPIIEESIQVEEVSEVIVEEIQQIAVEDEPEVTYVDQSYLQRRNDDDEELGLSEKAALDKNVKVIKPPKIKLQGLTVKGKIDLPEPKIKEEIVSVSEEKVETPVDPDKIVYTSGPSKDRKPQRNFNSKKRNPNYNPLEEERKRKALREKREKERQLKALKEAKSSHYNAQVVQKNRTTTKKRKVNSEVKSQEIQIETIKKTPIAPTNNPLKKFWRWMNT